jgi:hypothetical protein
VFFFSFDDSILNELCKNKYKYIINKYKNKYNKKSLKVPTKKPNVQFFLNSLSGQQIKMFILDPPSPVAIL